MIISYGSRDPVSYYQKTALERSIIFAGKNCDILPEDDLRYKRCEPDELREPAVMFTKVCFD